MNSFLSSRVRRAPSQVRILLTCQSHVYEEGEVGTGRVLILRSIMKCKRWMWLSKPREGPLHPTILQWTWKFYWVSDGRGKTGKGRSESWNFFPFQTRKWELNKCNNFCCSDPTCFLHTWTKDDQRYNGGGESKKKSWDPWEWGE